MDRSLYEPALSQAIAKYFGSLDPAAIDELEAELEWVELFSGASLMRAGDPADGMYILLAGRLSVYAPRAAEAPQLIGSIFRGEVVGEMGLLNQSARNATVIASRDSVLVHIGQAAFRRIYERHPGILLAFAQTIIDRLQHANERSVRALKPNVAVVPLHGLDGYASWLRELGAALNQTDDCYLVHREAAARELAMDTRALETPEGLASLGRWLAEIDHRDEYTLYEAEPRLSDWTRKCVRQADVVYLLVDPAEEEIDERLFDYLRERRHRHPEVSYRLVLLHDAETDLPRDTRSWLDRVQPDRHHHVRRENLRDLQRLSRFMLDRAVGLACGGGGAKGLAHIGIFRALREHDVAVDYVGGTSIGAILGATRALDWTEAELLAACEHAFGDRGISRDYHLPFFSLLEGRKKEDVLRALFDHQIEDLWFNFLCVSCSLSTNRMKVHEQGSLWEAITASSALPGVFPPFIQDGEFLVDGALMNNLPVDLLRDRGCGFVISADVSVAQPIRAEADAFPSNWDVLMQRFGFASPDAARFPSIFQTLTRSSYMASITHARAMSARADVTLRPAVGHIGLLEWDQMAGAIQAGYDCAHAHIETTPIGRR